MSGAEYDYEFSVWPAEGCWEQAMYQLFRMFNKASRYVFTGTEAEFSEFSASLDRSRITLREVERQPSMHGTEEA